MESYLSLGMAGAPIFLMSFNRPDYLAKVLDSLRNQADTDVAERQVALFQDGAVNPYSGKRHATDRDIKACVELFKNAFPRGTVMASPVNLGVALNFERAEKFGFEKLNAGAVIFLEDDLVLNRYYVSILDRLIDRFAGDTRLGYIAAYGDHKKTKKEPGPPARAQCRKHLGRARAP